MKLPTRKLLIEIGVLALTLICIAATGSHADGPSYITKTDKSTIKIRDLVRTTWSFTPPKIVFNQEEVLEELQQTKDDAFKKTYLFKKLNDNCTLTHGLGYFKNPKIEAGKRYRIINVLPKRDEVSIELTNLYNPVFSIVLECKKLTGDDSFDKLEAAVDHVFTIQVKD